MPEAVVKKKTLWRRMAALLGRLLLYAALVVALAASLLSVYLQSPAFEAYLADEIRAGLGQLLDSQVSLRGVRFDLLGERVIIYRLAIGAGAEGMPDPLRVERVTVHLRLRDLLRGRLTLGSVVMTRPEIRVEIDPEGRTNLPALREIEPGAWRLQVDRVDALAGSLIFRGRRIGWEMESGSVELTARRLGDGGHAGEAALGGLRLRLPELRPMTLDVDLAFRTESESIIGHALLEELDGSRFTVHRWIFRPGSGEGEATFSILADLGLVPEASESGLAGWVSGEGRLRFADESLELEARAEVPELRWGELAFGDVRQTIRIGDDSLFIDDLRAGFGDGTLAASFAVNGLSGERSLSGHLQTEGVPVRQLLDMAGLGCVLVDGRLAADLSLAGELARLEELQLEGEVLLQWNEDDVAPYREAVRSLARERDLAALEGAVVPLAGEASVRLAGGELRIAEGALLRSPLSEVRLSGTATADSLRLRLRSPSVSSAEVALVLASIERLAGGGAGPPEGRYPIASFIREFMTDGSAAMELWGRTENPSFNLRVRTASVAYRDRLLGEGQLRMAYADEEITLEQLRFQRGETALALAGTVAFAESGLEGTLTVEASGFDLERIDETLGLDVAGIGGEADARLQARLGPRLDVSGRVDVRGLRLGDVSFERASADVHLGDKLALRDLELIGPGEEFLGGEVDLDLESGDWQAALRGRGIELGRYVALLDPEIDLSGRVGVEIDAGGDRYSAMGEVNFSVHGLQSGNLRFGDLSGLLRADGSSGSLAVSDGESTYHLTAEVSEGSPKRLLVWMPEDESLDLTPLAQSFFPDERFYLILGGGIAASLPLEWDEEPTAEITVGNFTLGMEQFSATSIGAARVELRGSRLLLSDVSIVQGDQQATIGGWLEFSEAGRLNLNIAGEVDLVALSDFFEDFSFSGTGQLSLRVRGTVREPELLGDAELYDAFVRHKETNLTFSGIYGSLRLGGERVDVTEMTALFAGGVVDLDGFFDVDWATLSPGYFQFNIQGSALQLPLVEGLEATVDTDIIFRGGAHVSALSGEVYVRSALYSQRIEPETDLLRWQRNAPVPLADEGLSSVRLEVVVRGDENIRVDNNLANMDVGLELLMVGTLAEPVLMGRAEVQRGEVYYRDRRYTITSGVIDFVNPYRLEPHFDFRAETRVKEYRVFLDLHGTADNIYPELTSDPPASPVDVLHLLAVGRVRDNPFPSETERLQERLLGIGVGGFLTRQVTSELERRTERLFGIDRFRIDPFLLGDSANPTARVTIGEQVSERLSVVYSRNLAGSENTEQVLIVEYQLGPSMLLVATREEDGSYGIDLQMQRRFR